MAGFGSWLLEKQLVDRCMGGWPNGFCVVFVLCQPLRSHYSPIISSLDFTHQFEVVAAPLPAIEEAMLQVTIDYTAKVFHIVRESMLSISYITLN